MPYLTPETLPEERDCRALFIPASSAWLAIVSGALTELTRRYNWQQEGAVTVNEAVSAMEEMISEYYEGCASGDCEQPSGLPIFRLTDEGHVEQLVDGEWVEPVGEYAIPAITARTEPTPEENRCLAASNAVNVLQLIYEEALDLIQAGVAITDFVAGIIEVAGAAAFFVGSITAWFAGLWIAAWEIVRRGLAILSVDLWDSDFTEDLTCALFSCAQDVGGVVTFDYGCVMTALNEPSNWRDLTLERVRLLLQLEYIIMNIGGADGLNQAGAATAITSADCSSCDTAWCYVWFATSNDGGFEPIDPSVGTYSAGQWWTSDDVPAWFGIDRTLLYGQFDFPYAIEVETIDVHYNWLVGTSSNVTEGFGIYTEDFTQNLVSYQQDLMHDGTDEAEHLAPMVPYLLNDLGIWMQPAYNAYGGFAQMTIIQMTGHGAKPTFLEDMGWVEC